MRALLRASVTPLASIFGSGFLIIVPILTRTLGSLAVVGAAAVCLLAWLIGVAIRHNVRVVEDRASKGTLDTWTERLERASDVVIVVAYVISVALYVRIMAQYLVDALGSPDVALERLVATVAIALILVVGVLRGFGGLNVLERAALLVVLAVMALLSVAFVVEDGSRIAGGSFGLPAAGGSGLVETLLVLGGIVITVQGFETVRYLADEFDASLRIRACAASQLLAAGIYIVFTAVATPLVVGLQPSTLLDIVDQALPLLAVPLVICAVLSQLSAATADTAAAEGNLAVVSGHRLSPRVAYLLSGGAAIALCWIVSTAAIVAIASRAFAAYYALQCIVAMRTCDGRARQLGYGALAVVLVLIVLFARPAG